tara:strand:+ start:1034 stop:1519 length:486 start_codon:yes stop_codon:yes gene_type:complete
MDTATAPTREQFKKFEYEPPKLDQKHVRRAYRKINGFERIKALEPEHRRAVIKLERHYFGAQGISVRMDDDVQVDVDRHDEIPLFYHAGMLENAKRAVGSPRTWKALVCQMENTLTPQDIGHQWAAIKGRDKAKGFGEGLILSGLDALTIYWGLISQPPNR